MLRTYVRLGCGELIIATAPDHDTLRRELDRWEHDHRQVCPRCGGTPSPARPEPARPTRPYVFP